MAADPRDTDPADETPRERGLERRSGMPPVSPWVLVVLVVMLGAAVYVISAVMVR